MIFSGHYDAWREARINKILSIFGKDYFKDKTLLELGCGLGDIGRYFQTLGARVTFAEGRLEHVKEMKKRYNIDAIELDQDVEWDLNKKFDVVLHTGVLYHLLNWKTDLKCTLAHGDVVILETEVANRTDKNFVYSHRENSKAYDQSLHGPAVKIPAAAIEHELSKQGAEFKRYDDSDLNAGDHTYDWIVDDAGPAWKPARYRRFWVVQT